MPQNNQQSFLNKASWNAIASILSIAGRFAAGVVVARRLGPDGAGQVAYVLWMAEFISVVFGLGMRNSVQRYSSELLGLKGESSALNFARRRYLVYVLAMCFSIYPLVLWSHSKPVFQQTPYLIALLIIVHFLRAAENITYAILSGLHRFKTMAHFRAISSVALLLSIFPFVTYWGLRGAIASYILSSLPVVLGILPVILKRNIDAVPTQYDILKRFYAYSFFAWVTMINDTIIWSRSELYLLDRYCSGTEVGYYSVALTLSVMVTQIPMMVSEAFMTHFAVLSGESNRSDINRLHDLGTRLFALVIIPCALGAAAIMPVFIPLVYGSEFSPAIQVTMIVMGLTAVKSTSVGSMLVYGMNHAWFNALCGLVGVCIFILAGSIAVPQGGIMGAALVRVIVQLSMVLLRTAFIIYVLKISFPTIPFVKTAISALACAGAAWSVVSIWNNALSLVLAILIGVLVYAFFLKMTGAVADDEKQIFIRMTARLPHPLRKCASYCIEWLTAC